MKPSNWFIDRIRNISKRDIIIIATIFSFILVAVMLFFVFPGSEEVTADDPCLACHGDGGGNPRSL